MLYREAGTTLNLLSGIPRCYLEQGKRIRLTNVASYFGPLSLQASSELAENRIVADIRCDSDHKPACVVIRLPHPERQTAESDQGGLYDPPPRASASNRHCRAQVILTFAAMKTPSSRSWR